MRQGSVGARSQLTMRPRPLEELVHDSDPASVRAAATDPRMTEELALTLLERRDLNEHVLAELARNAAAMKHRRVIVGVVQHPRTPRHVSLPLTRRLFTFELMQLALVPALAADLKIVAEEAIIGRLETVSPGERMSLARRASGRVAAALLLDAEARIAEAALDNPYLNEAAIVKALVNDKSPAELARLVCAHSKWPLRRDVKAALLRNEHTPLARAIAIAHSLPLPVVREALEQSRMATQTRFYLLQDAERARAREHRAKRA